MGDHRHSAQPPAHVSRVMEALQRQSPTDHEPVDAAVRPADDAPTTHVPPMKSLQEETAEAVGSTQPRTPASGAHLTKAEALWVTCCGRNSRAVACGENSWPDLRKEYNKDVAYASNLPGSGSVQSSPGNHELSAASVQTPPVVAGAHPCADTPELLPGTMKVCL